jgi:hypothetical protein
MSGRVRALRRDHGNNIVLELGCFLMKGESLDPNATWRGNPVKAVSGPVALASAAWGQAI